MVYVDDMRSTYGRMIVCHMVADTTEELVAMADKIGVKRYWIQRPGTYLEHFDVCLSARARAVTYGAKEVTKQQFRAILTRKQKDYAKSNSSTD